jgi:tetratricopeptide (TPR) repeat protein
MRLPEGWSAEGHRLWEAGQHTPAIQTVVGRINALAAQQSPSPRHHEQLSYYLWLGKDLQGALRMLELACQMDPERTESRRNLSVLYGRAGLHDKAVEAAQAVLRQTPDDPVACDMLATELRHLNRLDEARAAGTQSLLLKDRQAAAAAVSRSGWSLPAQRASAGQHRIGDKPNVIAFSLWGTQPRYLRGALRNVLVAPGLFPGWTLRFYVDDSVPAGFIALLDQLGAQVVKHTGTEPSQRQRLCWRFQVANDAGVGYFLARDADSVLSEREARAVNAWLDGAAHFHVIRDWWSHTDLMLAGLWGGVAGVLPSMKLMLRTYQSAALETPNIDQWFLRDRVWPLVRHSVCMHDRLFNLPGTQPIPGPTPPAGGHLHIGQNEHAVRADEQARLLAHWIHRHHWL